MAGRLLALVAIAVCSAILVALILCGGRTLTQTQARTDAPGPPLGAGRRVSQTFIATTNGLVAIELPLATYATVPDGTLIANLRGPGDEVLAAWRVDASELRDNAWRRLELPRPVSETVGATLTLELSRPEDGGRPLTVWVGRGDPYGAGAFHVDGAQTGDDLAFRMEYRPGCVARALTLLSTTGRTPVVALLLLSGLFALPMAFLYTYARLHPSSDR